MQLPWTNTAVITVAASPLLSPWIDTTGFTFLIPAFSFVGGTSVHSLEGSFDGVVVDTDITYAAPTSGTVLTVLHPYIRWKTVQTVADATRSKVILKARP
jgi:hypothetical protein